MFSAPARIKFKSIAVLAILTNAFVGVLAASPVGAADGRSPPTHTYHFDLTQGAGTPVCDAYLKRLNTTAYTSPPYCGRPETTMVPGFAPLHRVPLSVEEVHVLYPRINLFMQLGKQGSKEEDDANEARRKKLGLASGLWSLDDVKGFVKKGQTTVWRYGPPVDIDNDGVPDNVLVWQGMGVSTTPGVCGVPTSVGPDARFVYRQNQSAFVLAVSNDRLDIPKTIEIFGHPSGSYRLSDGTTSTKFRPVGDSIGIFKYQDLYYFDTFFDSWGDLGNKRANDPEIASTLAVLLRQHGKTKQVCEYRMTVEPVTSSRGK